MKPTQCNACTSIFTDLCVLPKIMLALLVLVERDLLQVLRILMLLVLLILLVLLWLLSQLCELNVDAAVFPTGTFSA